MTVQISVKSVSGTSITLDVNPSQSISEILIMLQEKDSSITASSSSLVYAGKPLDNSKTVADYSIPSDTTLHLTTSNPNFSTTVTAAPTPSPRRTKKRCSFKNCISAPIRIVGDCGFCDGHFCSKHRLLEQHNCTGLHNCKAQLHERNAVKLQQEQTVANKV